MKTELESKVSMLLSITEAIMQFKKEIAIEIYKNTPNCTPIQIGSVAQRITEEVFSQEIKDMEEMGK